MKETTGTGCARQGNLEANSQSVLVELLAVQRRIEAFQAEGVAVQRQVLDLVAKVTESQSRGTEALERILTFVAAAAGKPVEPAPAKSKAVKRQHRTEREITRIVKDAIDMVSETGWSDRRIARELGVDRMVFCTRGPYVAARLEADIKFAKPDEDAKLEE